MQLVMQSQRLIDFDELVRRRATSAGAVSLSTRLQMMGQRCFPTFLPGTFTSEDEWQQRLCQSARRKSGMFLYQICFHLFESLKKSCCDERCSGRKDQERASEVVSLLRYPGSFLLVLFGIMHTALNEP